MTDLDHIPEPLRPLWRPFLATILCFGVSMTCFSSWSDVPIPTAPEDLTVVRISIDDVSYPARPFTGKQSRGAPAVITHATSKDWPGVIFDFSSTSFSVEPPVTLNIYTDQDLNKAAAAVKGRPNDSIAIRVFGIATDAGIVVDPGIPHRMMVRLKGQWLLAAWVSLGLALLAGAFLAWRIRSNFFR